MKDLKIPGADAEVALGVWPTAWGPMGGVWGSGGLLRVVLPHYGLKDLRDLLSWQHQAGHFDEAAFGDLPALCQGYFKREAVDFSSVVCDLSHLAAFGRAVLEACRRVPFGKTLSYTQFALASGLDGKQRAAAQALGANPVPLVIPCHRVILAGGGPGGFSADGGVEMKLKMLAMEKDAAGSTA